MKRKFIVAIVVGMWVMGSALASVSDVCSIGYFGVNTTTAGLWVQLTGTSEGSAVPAGTWATSSSTDPTVVNRLIAIFVLAKSMGSPVWVQGTLTNGIFYIDSAVIP